MTMLDEQGVGAFIDAHCGKRGDHLFRMELLPTYRVDSDGDEPARWQGGATEPTWSLKQPWLDTPAREHEAGLVSQRVRILSAELTDYELMACHRGYATAPTPSTLTARSANSRIMERRKPGAPRQPTGEAGPPPHRSARAAAPPPPSGDRAGKKSRSFQSVDNHTAGSCQHPRMAEWLGCADGPSSHACRHDHLLGPALSGVHRGTPVGHLEADPVAAAVGPLVEFGAVDRHGPRVRITALGRWGLQAMQARAPKPITADLPAAELITRLTTVERDARWYAAQPWLVDRAPSPTARDLLHAAAASPAQRVAAVELVHALGEEAEPAWADAQRWANLAAHARAIGSESPNAQDSV